MLHWHLNRGLVNSKPCQLTKLDQQCETQCYCRTSIIMLTILFIAFFSFCSEACKLLLRSEYLPLPVVAGVSTVASCNAEPVRRSDGGSLANFLLQTYRLWHTLRCDIYLSDIIGGSFGLFSKFANFRLPNLYPWSSWRFCPKSKWNFTVVVISSKRLTLQT